MSQLTISTQEKRFPVAPDLYGLFFEDISHAGDGGLYPEMLRNRSFEDSLLPDGCITNDNGKTFTSPTGWIDEFNNGEGMNDWIASQKIAPTTIPAWYSENANMQLNKDNTLNDNRRVSLQVDFEENGKIYNIGYNGINQEKGDTYNFYLFAKSEQTLHLTVSIQINNQTSCSSDIIINDANWKRYDAQFLATETARNATFSIQCKEKGTLYLGFCSLMPAETFHGHGLRKDLAEKLEQMHPSFLRFPGGCIVEGFTLETAMFFCNTVGPVWERPSHWLLWHYRTTNGLGFHEYMQLCEDLKLSALYVCNCGMTCQGRGPYYFNEAQMQFAINDTLNALEYALGSSQTHWGSLRAKMGHPEPFSLKYLEIGNENSGTEYEACFNRIREAVLERYPQIIIVSNTRSETIKTDIVDDHYYNMPEFFAENIDIYDDYSRKNPNIFVGEFAVNQTYEGQLRAAISEAMFMVGFERNQDVVKLCSYAPLFSHVHYQSWYPNLIMFDNSRSYVIPSYYCFKLFGANRGDMVVSSKESCEKIYLSMHGLPVINGDCGLTWKNAVFNSIPVFPTKSLHGKAIQDNDSYVLQENDDDEFTNQSIRSQILPGIALGNDVESREGSFTVQILAEKGKRIGVGMLCSPKPFSYYDRTDPNPKDPWMLFNLEPLRWIVEGNTAALYRGGISLTQYSEPKQISLRYGEYNEFHYELTKTAVSLYLNGKLIDTVELPHYQSMCSVTTDTDDSVIIKIVNFSETDDPVCISIDCDVKSEYEVSQLTGKADFENSLDNPDQVHDTTTMLTGAGRCFTFTAPGLSVNVLKLKKK